jgi:hypothetical protein
MKHILLSALLVASLPALAQTEKGRLMVGVGLANISAGIHPDGGSEGVDYFNVGIGPTAGYFIAKNFALGTGIGLSWGKSGSSTSLSYGVSPFARYYFGEKKTKLFIHADAGIHQHRIFNTPSVNDRFTMTTFAAGPGVTHFLNQNVALETSLLFRGIANRHIETLSFMPSLNFGFQIYLNGFKKVKPVPVPVVEEE